MVNTAPGVSKAGVLGKMPHPGQAEPLRLLQELCCCPSTQPPPAPTAVFKATRSDFFNRPRSFLKLSTLPRSKYK